VAEHRPAVESGTVRVSDDDRVILAQVYGGEYLPEHVERVLRSCCQGHYQVALIGGAESWSGNTLRGKAAAWGGAYARSRASLYRRLRVAAAEIGWEVQIGECYDTRPPMGTLVVRRLGTDWWYRCS